MKTGRPRKGSIELRKGSLHARMTVTVNGVTGRQWFDLRTTDMDEARKEMARILEELERGAPPRVGRPRKGTIRRNRQGRWQAIVTLSDGTRKRLPPLPEGTSEEKAREFAEYWAKKAAEIPVEAPQRPRGLGVLKSLFIERLAMAGIARETARMCSKAIPAKREDVSFRHLLAAYRAAIAETMRGEP